MDIRFISSLTPEDENAFAPALLKAVSAVLDQFPIAYTIRMETTGAQVYQGLAGLLLVSALMVVPVATAQLVTRGFGTTMALSMALGLASGVAGIVISGPNG